MILVFVSKNDEEFNRYVRGCGDKKIRRTYSFRPKINDAVAMDAGTWIPQMPSLSAAFGDMESRVAAEHSGAQQQINLEDSGIITEYVFPLESMSEYHTSGVFVVAIRSSSDINKLKSDSKNSEDYRGSSTKKFLSLIAEIVKETFPDDKYKIDKQDIYLLVHWGNVTDLKAEEDKFNRVINENGYNKFIGCKCLRFHELSSRRPSFNVQGHLIKVPVKKEEVDELLKCFEAEREFVDVKDYMTKYLYDPACVQQKMIEFMATKEFRSKIREIAKESKFKWLLGWTLFRDFLKVAEDENAVKKAVKKILKAPDKDNQEKSRALISQLLSEGIV